MQNRRDEIVTQPLHANLSKDQSMTPWLVQVPAVPQQSIEEDT
jgi:hypothetical protein